ncbi:MAG: matrixin family metalloprotease [Alphaproteobacteria bacterium]|nr:matrixin family metalloprotease [Alphaproteobacteria bacterium]
MCRIIAGIIALLSVCCGLHADPGYRFLEIDGHNVKWGAPSLGQGATLTYAVVDSQTTVAGTVNCRALRGMNTLLTRSKVAAQVFSNQLSAAFALWSAKANVSFRAATDPEKADIVVAAEAQDDGIAYTDVAPAVSDGGAILPLRRAIICLNPTVTWTASVQSSAGSYRLEYVLAHEIGHVLGLDHPSPRGEIMSFEYSSAAHVALQPGDIAGIIALYGEPEPGPVLALASASHANR